MWEDLPNAAVWHCRHPLSDWGEMLDVWELAEGPQISCLQMSAYICKDDKERKEVKEKRKKKWLEKWRQCLLVLDGPVYAWAHTHGWL